MDALSCIDQCFISDGTLEQLPAPSQVGKSRVGGIDFNKPRMRWVAQAVLSLSASPRGFTASELADQVRMPSHQTQTEYHARRAGYDLKKLRGKQLIRRIAKTQRYEPIPDGLKAMTAVIVLHDKIIKPLLAAAKQRRPSHGAQNPTAIDRHYEVIRVEMGGLFRELGLSA